MITETTIAIDKVKNRSQRILSDIHTKSGYLITQLLRDLTHDYLNNEELEFDEFTIEIGQHIGWVNVEAGETRKYAVWNNIYFTNPPECRKGEDLWINQHTFLNCLAIDFHHYVYARSFITEKVINGIPTLVIIDDCHHTIFQFPATAVTSIKLNGSVYRMPFDNLNNYITDHGDHLTIIDPTTNLPYGEYKPVKNL